MSASERESTARFHRARALFDALCDLPERERRERLAALSDEDEQLAARVRELLEADARAGAMLGASAAQVLGLRGPEDATRLRLPGLELQEVLGVGGVGVVYRARQETPERTVAVKLLRPGWVTRSSLQRFEHEARVLGWLSHPGIATVFDAGRVETDAGPQPYLVLELVQGMRVDAYADHLALGTGDRLRLVRDIARAVHHAHQKGVVHRDLKPANVLVDGQGQVKVLDFGVARILDGAGASHHPSRHTPDHHTAPGEVLGTLPYMSPEQVRADPAEIDIRADVYALGALAYKLLAGRCPHELDAVPVHEALRILHEEEPVPLGELRPELRGDVSTLVHKALAKEKERRYASCEELAQDIQRFLLDEPILAVRPSRTYVVRKFARRNRLALGAGAAVLVALVTGLVLALFGWARALDERDQKDQALREAERATSFLGDLLSEVSPERSGRDVPLRTVLDRATERIAAAFDEEPRVAARLLAMVGNTYLALGDVEPALATLERAYRLSREADALLDHRQRYASAYGGALRVAGRLQAAEDVLREGLALLEDPGSAPDVHAGLLHQLGVVYRHRGRFDEAEPCFRRAIAVARESFGPDHELTLISTEGLAVLMSERGRLTEAQPLLEDLVVRFGHLYGPEDVRTLQAHYNLATLYSLRGWTGKALEQDERILEARVRRLGPEHPDTADAMVAVGQGYSKLGRFDDALGLLEEASGSLASELGALHPRTLMARSSLAIALGQSGDPAASGARTAELVPLFARTFGPLAADTLRMRMQSGLMSGKAGDHAAALEALRALLSDCEEALGPAHRTTVACRVNIGKVLQWAGRRDEALAAFDAARAAADASSAYEGSLAALELARLLLAEPRDVEDARRALALAREAQIDVTVERRAYGEVLARAHFAAGEVAEAVAVQESLPERLPAMTAEEREAWAATLERYRSGLESASE